MMTKRGRYIGRQLRDATIKKAMKLVNDEKIHELGLPYEKAFNFVKGGSDKVSDIYGPYSRRHGRNRVRKRGK